MAKKKQLVLIGFPQADWSTHQKHLKPLADVHVARGISERTVSSVQGAGCQVALLYYDGAPDAVLTLTRQLAQTECQPIVVSGARDPEVILSAMRAGARDFAYLNGSYDDVVRAVEALPNGLSLAPATQVPPPPPPGRVISVFSCKGGSGATTIALNLAGALMSAKSEGPASVVVVDVDTETGDVLTFLDQGSKYTFEDVLGNMQRLDPELLHQSLARHPSGLSVLSQADRVGEAAELTSEGLGQVIQFLRGQFDFVVLDGLRGFRELPLVALDRADVVLCTMTQDVPGLKNASHCFNLFKQLGYPDEKLQLVINRYRNAGDLTEAAVSDILRRSVAGTVANDYPNVIKAVNNGVLLAESDPNGKVYRDIQGLLPVVYDEAVVAKRPSLFSRWRKR